MLGNHADNSDRENSPNYFFLISSLTSMIGSIIMLLRKVTEICIPLSSLSLSVLVFLVVSIFSRFLPHINTKESSKSV